MRTHRQIAEELLGHAIDADGYAPCPGAHLHTTANGLRDFRITFDPAGEAMPKSHCFHAACDAARGEFMRALYRAIAAERRGNTTPAQAAARRNALPPPPTAAAPPRPQLDMEAVERIAAAAEPLSPADLLAASPVPIPTDRTAWAPLLLDTLYSAGQRILIFTRFRSQGQYLYEIGRGAYRLGDKPGIKAVRSPRLPHGGPQGVWYLTAPVAGTWQPNPNNTREGITMLGRRHAACCTACPYAVIESDSLPAATWLRLLTRMSWPIAAVYSSGGKSLHTLIRVNAPTPEAFAPWRIRFLRTLVRLGADPAAITAVRLSRLPGCIRAEKLPPAMAAANETYPRHIPAGDDLPAGLQRLLYLNPAARSGIPLLEQAAAARKQLNH